MHSPGVSGGVRPAALSCKNERLGGCGEEGWRCLCEYEQLYGFPGKGADWVRLALFFLRARPCIGIPERVGCHNHWGERGGWVAGGEGEAEVGVPSSTASASSCKMS